MFELRRLDPSAIPAALEKALRYRMLNEPMSAESICLDVLAVESDNQAALVTLALALSDQFEQRAAEKFTQAEQALLRLRDEYSRAYYHGILCERRAKLSFTRGGHGSGCVAYEWFRQAMSDYERAALLQPQENNDSTLRWNTCARILNEHPELQAESRDSGEQMLE